MTGKLIRTSFRIVRRVCFGQQRVQQRMPGQVFEPAAGGGECGGLLLFCDGAERCERGFLFVDPPKGQDRASW